MVSAILSGLGLKSFSFKIQISLVRKSNLKMNLKNILKIPKSLIKTNNRYNNATCYNRNNDSRPFNRHILFIFEHITADSMRTDYIIAQTLTYVCNDIQNGRIKKKFPYYNDNGAVTTTTDVVTFCMYTHNILDNNNNNRKKNSLNYYTKLFFPLLLLLFLFLR